MEKVVVVCFFFCWVDIKNSILHTPYQPVERIKMNSCTSEDK